MSETQAVPVAGTPAPVATPKPNAIQLIEAELANFIKQAEVAAKNVEQAVANVHAIQGAIQGTKHLLAKLQGAAIAAEAEVKKVLGEAKPEAVKIVTEVETEEKTVVADIEAEAKKL